MTTVTAYANPYWDAVRDFVRDHDYSWDKGLYVGGFGTGNDRNAYLRRDALTSQYAWTITDPSSVEFVVEQCGPRVIDPMAGTGYWAWLLRQHGADVAASDLTPPGGATKNHWHRSAALHTEVVSADAVDAVTVFGDDRVLLLSWPPYDDPIGAEVIEAYAGKRIVYIGENNGGCCGNDHMWGLLHSWAEVAEHKPVQWYGLHDWVTVFERAS